MEELDGYLEQRSLLETLEAEQELLRQRIAAAYDAKKTCEQDFIESRDACELDKQFVYSYKGVSYLVTAYGGKRFSESNGFSVDPIRVVAPVQPTTNPA